MPNELLKLPPEALYAHSRVEIGQLKAEIDHLNHRIKVLEGKLKLKREELVNLQQKRRRQKQREKELIQDIGILRGRIRNLVNHD